MSAAAPASPILRFATFELNVATGELRKCGMALRLRPQAKKLLIVLVSRHGQIVTREQLKHEIWGDNVFVDFEHGLNLCIRQIRAVLDDDADTPRYIETVPRCGYRFIAAVEEVVTEAGVPSGGEMTQPASAVAEQTRPESGNWTRPRLVWAIGALLLTVVATIVLLTFKPWLGQLARTDRSVRIESLAVLPLENLSNDKEQDYFADGMTDELITELAQVHALRVISRQSIMQYKGKRKPIQQIARELNVNAVVEGTVMRSGERVRITAQLIAVPEDRHLWADAFEGDIRSVLAVQEQVAIAIARAVKVNLSAQEQTQLANARAVDPEAHEAYLRGLHELRGGRAAKAITFFQQAVARDANDPLAYVGLAVAYTSASTELPPLESMPKARAAALKAIQLDDTLAEAHTALGFVRLVFDWDWSGAEQELRSALELNPNSPLAHAHYAEYLLLVSHRVDEGIHEFRRAYALDPLAPTEQGDLVWFLYDCRRYTDAIAEAGKELEDDSPFLALAYAELGRRDEALAVADRAAKSATLPVVIAQAASAYAKAGKKDRASALLNQLLRQSQNHYMCGMNMAAVYSALGDKDQAFAWLEKAYRDRSG